MSGVHPRGEAGLMNDWQKRLQQAQVAYAERMRRMRSVCVAYEAVYSRRGS
jgi:hypothetical protein